VNDLAAALGVTDNAIRAQLAILERDGLVAESGQQRGTRKPHVAYALTAAAERLFPKPYEPLLRELLTVLGREVPSDRLDEMLRAAGRRLAVGLGAAEMAADAPVAGLRARVEGAVEVLGQLGGMASVEEAADGRLTIRGRCCPIQAAVSAYPGSCRVAEAMLTQIVGAPVRERCEKGESPRCCFEVGGTP
jgi:predicted ArsR family transcriptional regulator